MNRNPARAAPARPARKAAGNARPDSAAVDAFLAALAFLLATLLRAWARPRAGAATPAQHRRALRDLRALRPVHALPARQNPFRPSRQARRRAAECWRMLTAPPRRHATFPRPTSTRRTVAARPRLFRQPPPARAGPRAPPASSLPPASPPHAFIVPISK